MNAPSPQQRRAARLIVKIDRDLGRQSDPQVLAVAGTEPDEPAGARVRRQD